MKPDKSSVNTWIVFSVIRFSFNGSCKKQSLGIDDTYESLPQIFCDTAGKLYQPDKRESHPLLGEGRCTAPALDLVDFSRVNSFLNPLPILLNPFLSGWMLAELLAFAEGPEQNG